MQAVAHWRELAIDVLGAARAAVSSAPRTRHAGRGRLRPRDHRPRGRRRRRTSWSTSRFEPDLEDVGNGEVAGTPAQIMALSLLDTLEGDQPPPEVA